MTILKSLKMHFRTRITFIFYVCLLLLLIPWLAILSRWGFDEIHEGQLLLSVKSLESGMIIHRDFFEYKGLLTPILLSLMHPDSLPLVISLRVIMVFFIFSSAVLAYLYLKPFAHLWALVLPISWIMLSPVNALWSSKPWPNKILIDPGVTTTLVVVLVLVLISKNELLLKRTGAESKVLLISVGVLLGLLPWNRIQNTIISIGITALILSRSQFSRRVRVVYAFTYLLTINIPLFYLFANSAFAAWFKQIIKTPQDLRSDGSNMVVMSNWQTLTTFFSFLFISFFILLVSQIPSKKFFRQWRRVDYARFVLTLLVAVFACLCSLNWDLDRSLNNSLRNWILIGLQWSPFGLWHLVIVATFAIVATASFIYIGKKLFGFPSSDSWFSSFETRVVMMASLNSIVFLYPNVGNLWTSALPASLFVIKVLQQNHGVRSGFSSIMQIRFQALLVAFSLVSALSIYFGNSTMVYKFRSPDLQQLKTNRIDSVMRNDDIFLMSKRILGSRNTYNLCPYGLSAFPQEKYLPNSSNWGEIVYTVPNRDSSELARAKFLLVCSNSLENSDFIIPEEFRLIVTKKVDGDESISLYIRNAG